MYSHLVDYFPEYDGEIGVWVLALLFFGSFFDPFKKTHKHPWPTTCTIYSLLTSFDPLT